MQSTRQPAEVNYNVYYQRAVSYDKNGRVSTGMGGPSLGILEKGLKTVMGVYHVGVAVGGVEYTFGMSRGYNTKRLGSDDNGVWVHEPTRAGPGNVFCQTVCLGTTQHSAEQVEQIAIELGEKDFQRSKYNRINHNCTDFARRFCKDLGASQEPPSWSHRGADLAKMFGWGGGKAEAAAEAEEDAAQGRDAHRGYLCRVC